MKPIYFPFTYISEQVLEAFSAFFKQVVVYQPSPLNTPESMQKFANSGLLEIRIPVKGDENKIYNALKDYKSWSNIHQGSEMAFFKTRLDMIPFFGEFSTSQIKADIKKKSQQYQVEKKASALLNTRIFLHIAQEFDSQNWETNKNLMLLEEKTLHLIDKLKGKEKTLLKVNNIEKTLKIDYQSDYMVLDRIIAWTHMLQNDQNMSDILITNSRSAIESLLDNTPKAKIVLSVESKLQTNIGDEKKEKWHQSIMKQIELFLEKPPPVSEDIKIQSPFYRNNGKKVSLTFYLIPNESPNNFFARSVWNKTDVKGINKQTTFKNTLIGLVEWP